MSITHEHPAQGNKKRTEEQKNKETKNLKWPYNA